MRINDEQVETLTESPPPMPPLSRRSIRAVRARRRSPRPTCASSCASPAAHRRPTTSSRGASSSCRTTTLKSQLARGGVRPAAGAACASHRSSCYSDMRDALERMPEAMHPDMPADKRDAGVESFRATFAGQTVEEREGWGNAQSNIALGYLLLLAESLGFATSPMLGFDPAKVKELLGLPGARSHFRARLHRLSRRGGLPPASPASRLPSSTFADPMNALDLHVHRWAPATEQGAPTAAAAARHGGRRERPASAGAAWWRRMRRC